MARSATGVYNTTPLKWRVAFKVLNKFCELCISILSFLRDAFSDSRKSILAKSAVFTVTCDCESSDSFTNVKLQHGSEDMEHLL